MFANNSSVCHKAYHECSLSACAGNITSKCVECPFWFCFYRGNHKHAVCCAIDQGVQCLSNAVHEEENYYYCSLHFQTFARAKCYACGKLQPKSRREYQYCLACIVKRDTESKERHRVFWTSLQPKGVNGPYGAGNGQTNTCALQ
jgi:hypothetical protein